MSARVARFELPGKRWFFASCQECRWLGLDWKFKDHAKREMLDHNARKHQPEEEP